MSFGQEAVEPLDMDEYVDFSQGHASPSNAAAKSLQAPEHTTPRPRPSMMRPANPFAAPSHQYGLHKQQSSLPLGGLATTMAANRPPGVNGVNFGNTNFGLQDDIFDFSAMPANPPVFNAMAEVDMDFGSPVEGLMHAPADGDFVDPHALGASRDASPPPGPEAVRMWPGMHTQQAARAKQQQQQEIQRQQQLKIAQQPAGVSSQLHRRVPSKPMNTGKPMDPMAEESISRLLSQMRHGSIVSSNGDAPSSTHVGRSRKDEEDMDEDEKLLASEEGKKLSSKERRQLRNKVSARAFRSRRKEYITQLEGEISSKSQENDDLRAENEALRSENMRLTDLSKMLLSSPAFSTFLNDLSANGVAGLPQALAQQQQRSMAQQQQQQQQQQMPAAKPQPPKDINPHQSQMRMQQQQQAMQGGMTVGNEQDIDFSNLDANGSWGVGMDFGFDAQVFQVTDLPTVSLSEAPDTGVLSGKAASVLPSLASEPKAEVPTVEASPIPEPAKVVPVVDETVDFDESNPAYALFADVPAAACTSPVTDDYAVFGAIPLEKAFARVELTVVDADGEMSTADMVQFEALQRQLDDLSARIGSYLS